MRGGAGWPVSDARRFFASYFETARVGDGAAFATGYYEPEIRGSRTRAPATTFCGLPRRPSWSAPGPMTRPKASAAVARRSGATTQAGKFVPFYDRSEIELGALARARAGNRLGGRSGRVLLPADPGLRLLRLPDGSLMRIGYAGQNGREYVGIGRVMRERGLIGEGTEYATSMQGIMAYIRDHPARRGEALMNLNKSWIFFRELDTDGPLGVARRAGAAQSLGGGRSQLRTLWRAGLPRP